MATSSNGKANGKIVFPEGYTASALMGMVFPPPRWAVPGVLAHGLCLLGGMPKFGKSWWMLNLGLAVASGGRAFGQIQVEQGEVLYLALEDDWEGLQERLAILSGDAPIPDGLHLFNTWPRMGKSQGTTLLSEWLDQHPLCRLAMIDTLPAIRPIGGNSRTLYDDDYNTASALKSVADKHKVPLVTSMHLTKIVRDDPFMGFNATLGLTGGCDQMIVLQAGMTKTDATMHIKGRRVRWQDYALKWDSITAQWGLLGKAEDYKKSHERAEIKRILREAPLPQTPTEVARALQKNVASVKQLMWMMLRDGELKSADGHYSLMGEVKANQGGFISFTGGAISQDDLLPQGEMPWPPVNSGRLLSLPGKPVNAVNPVNTVNGVKGDALACIACGAELPDGWYVRCPLCEEKVMAEMAEEGTGGS